MPGPSRARSIKRDLAIVTGATSGIGRAAALRLVDDGYTVAGIGLGSESVKTLNAEMQTRDGDGYSVAGDVSDPRTVETFVGSAVAKWGSVRVLVNCAGIRIGGTVESVKEGEWESTIRVNLKGVYLVSRAVLPQMAVDGGSIINISSVSAFGNRGVAAYAASKAGIIGLTRAMACDLLDRRIRCNVVAPGAVRTAMVDDQLATKDETEQQSMLAWMARANIQGRVATPDDIVGVISFLASSDAEMITGAVIEVATLPGPSTRAPL